MFVPVICLRDYFNKINMMTQEEFLKRLDENFNKCIMIATKKNADYAGEADPFKNFRLATLAGITVEQGMAIRMTDKLSRIGNLLNKPGKVENESIFDTLDDLINYANILKVYLEYGKGQE